MKTLIVGPGALGVLIAARLQAAGLPVSLAARTAESAAQLNRLGLQVRGLEGDVTVKTPNCAPLDAYSPTDAFDLIIVATKAHDAFNLARRLIPLLSKAGVLLPIQNGAVARLLAEQHGHDRVL